VVFDLRACADFACDDPDANVMVIMQSPANWWMNLGTVSLKEAKQWKTYRFGMTKKDHTKAVGSAINIIFVLLQANKPVKGSVYFDQIGFMVR
jgi:hypothetical protein